MTTSRIENLIAAHTVSTGTDTESVEESYEVRMHDAKVARQERLNRALGLK